MTALTLSKTFSAPNAGTPIVTVNRGATDKAPLLAEFLVDISTCDFDNTEDYDALFGLDYTGKFHDPSYHRLMYLWDLDDAEANWTAPRNIPAEYVNRSRAMGKKIMHIYTTKQVVNWKLEIWEPSSGKKAYASGSFSVSDPLETAAHIVLVNPNGDTDFTQIDRAGYPGAAFHEHQLDVDNRFANNAVDAGGVSRPFDDYEALDNVCWLFKTGGSYDISLLHDGSGAFPYFGKYGTASPANPVVISNNGNKFSCARGPDGIPHEMRVQNLDFRGNWTDYETVTITKPTNVQCFDPKGGWKYVIADCSLEAINGVSVVLSNPEIDTEEFHVGIANTVLHGIAGAEYPLILGNTAFSSNSTFCFVGNRFTDYPTLMSAPDQGAVNPDHRAFIRVNTLHGIHVRSSDFFRLAGGHGQPVMKLNKQGRTDVAPYIHVQFCAGEGSENFINFTEDDAGTASVPVLTRINNAIVECSLYAHLPCGTGFSGGASTGSTCRSNLLVSGTWADKTLSQGESFYRTRHIHAAGNGGTQTAYPPDNDAPSEMYNCHVVHLRPQAQQEDKVLGDAQFADGEYTRVFSDVAEGTPLPDGGSAGDPNQIWRVFNNFVHAPHQTGGDAVTTYAPIKDDPAREADGITRPDGTKMRFRFTGYNPAGTPDASYSYNGAYIPGGQIGAGSAAIGNATGAISWPLDYLGRICGPRRSRGASDRPDYVFSLRVRQG